MSMFKAKSLGWLVAAIALCVGLVACSGSGKAPPVQTGQFVDAAVIGANYVNSPSGLSGTTDANGNYDFMAGDTVTFSIGNIVFPAVTAKGTVTPLDLADTTDINNPTVVNIARLLQSLDTDSDPSNGITLDSSVTGSAYDFTQSVADFEADFKADFPNLNLVSQADALAHLQAELDALAAGNSNGGGGDGGSLVFTGAGAAQLKTDATFTPGVGESEQGPHPVLPNAQFRTIKWNVLTTLAGARDDDGTYVSVSFSEDLSKLTSVNVSSGVHTPVFEFNNWGKFDANGIAEVAVDDTAKTVTFTNLTLEGQSGTTGMITMNGTLKFDGKPSACGTDCTAYFSSNATNFNVSSNATGTGALESDFSGGNHAMTIAADGEITVASDTTTYTFSASEITDFSAETNETNVFYTDAQTGYSVIYSDDNSSGIVLVIQDTNTSFVRLVPPS